MVVRWTEPAAKNASFALVMFSDFGKTLIFLGLILLGLGLIWTFLPLSRLGRLPGDIVIRRQNWSLYLPITTSVLLSLALTLVVWILSIWRR